MADFPYARLCWQHMCLTGNGTPAPYAAEWLGPYCDQHGDAYGAAWCALFLMAVDEAAPPAEPAASYTFAAARAARP